MSRWVAATMRTSAIRDARAHWLEAAVGQEAEQLDRRCCGHFADFVEEQRAASCGLDEPGTVAHRASEIALEIVKQLAFEQLVWNRTTVDQHEFTLSPLRCLRRPAE